MMTVYNCNCLHVSIIRVIHVRYYHIRFSTPSSYCLRVVLQELHVQCTCTCTLFTAVFAMFNLLCSLNSVCIPSFVLIGYCVSELLCSSTCIMCVPIAMYGLKLYIVVLQELQCLPNYLHVIIIRDVGFYHFTKFLCSTPSSPSGF